MEGPTIRREKERKKTGVLYISDSECNAGPSTRTTSITSATSRIQHEPTFSVSLGLYTRQCSVNVIGDVACEAQRERVWTRAPVNTNGSGTCSNVEMCLNVCARDRV